MSLIPANLICNGCNQYDVVMPSLSSAGCKCPPVPEAFDAHVLTRRNHREAAAPNPWRDRYMRGRG